MATIVAALLAGLSQFLKPDIDENKANDVKGRILKTVFIDKNEGPKNNQEVKDIFDERITQLIIDHEGNPKEVQDPYDASKMLSAFQIDFKKEMKLDTSERSYPLFIYEGDEGKFFIFPLVGQGLWDEINGYIALEGDLNTIRGAAFDHVGETPGLGGEISSDDFQDQFWGKIDNKEPGEPRKIFDEKGEYKLEIVKAGTKGKKEIKNSEYLVNGMSGATITTQGADKMIKNCLTAYQAYFSKNKQ